MERVQSLVRELRYWKHVVQLKIKKKKKDFPLEKTKSCILNYAERKNVISKTFSLVKFSVMKKKR